jgi:uncharacterized protein
MLAHFVPAQRSVPRIEATVDTAIGADSVRLYLSPIRVDSAYRLTPNGYSGGTHVEQSLNFEDRGDSPAIVSVVGVPTRAIDTWNEVQFVSPALAGPFELAGTFSGRVEVVTNKPDFDFEISLFELTPQRDYILVSTYSSRSDTVAKTSHREPLQPGIRQYRDYRSASFPSRMVPDGSRLVVSITILKPADPVALKIAWYGDSYIDLHVRHH